MPGKYLGFELTRIGDRRSDGTIDRWSRPDLDVLLRRNRIAVCRIAIEHGGHLDNPRQPKRYRLSVNRHPRESDEDVTACMHG